MVSSQLTISVNFAAISPCKIWKTLVLSNSFIAASAKSFEDYTMILFPKNLIFHAEHSIHDICMNEKIPYLFHQLTGNRFTTIFWCSFSSILKPACLTKPFVTAAFFFLVNMEAFLQLNLKFFQVIVGSCKNWLLVQLLVMGKSVEIAFLPSVFVITFAFLFFLYL